MKLSAAILGDIKTLLAEDGNKLAVALGQTAMSVRLGNQVTGATIGGGVLLFAEPNATHGAPTNATYIVTSKYVLQMYNAGNACPPFSMASGAPLVTLITAFCANVFIDYSGSLWSAPPAPPPPPPGVLPAGFAKISKAVFKEGDSSWDYDLMLLESTDQGLFDFATGVGTGLCACAWDASAWTSTADMPSPAGILSFYANEKGSGKEKRSVLLSGFGDTPPPISVLPSAATFNGATSTASFAVPVPTGVAIPPPATPIPANSLQVRFATAKATAPAPDAIRIWPIPAVGSPVTMNDTFTPERKCVHAAMLTASEECTCVAEEIGGGGFKLVDAAPFVVLVGVVSGLNGTTWGKDEFTGIFKKVKTAKKKDQAGELDKLVEALPWPPQNQVLTLITDMLDNWPLAWPPVAEGFFKDTQTDPAKAFVVAKYSQATPTSAGQAIQQAFGAQGKPTECEYSCVNILHASAGVKGVVGGVTIFYTQYVSNGTLKSIQIVAIGHHVDLPKGAPKHATNAYYIEWILDADSETKQNSKITMKSNAPEGFPVLTEKANYYL